MKKSHFLEGKCHSRSEVQLWLQTSYFNVTPLVLKRKNRAFQRGMLYQNHMIASRAMSFRKNPKFKKKFKNFSHSTQVYCSYVTLSVKILMKKSHFLEGKCHSRSEVQLWLQTSYFNVTPLVLKRKNRAFQRGMLYQNPMIASRAMSFRKNPKF